jgi:membrane associated rhomboid family serine protease
MCFVPYNVDVAMRRVPVANWVLIGLTVVLSTALLIEDSPYLREATDEERVVDALYRASGTQRHAPPGPLFKLLVLQPGRDFRVTQLVGHLFAHRDFLHLAGNMIFLFCFGNAINAKFGHVFFLLFYLGIGVFNALAFATVDSGGIGSSAAIWGVTGAFVVLYPKNVVKVYYWVVFDWGATEISSLILVAVFFVFELLSLYLDEGYAMSFVGHVVGACCGFGLTALLVKSGVIQSTIDEENLLEILKVD